MVPSLVNPSSVRSLAQSVEPGSPTPPRYRIENLAVQGASAIALVLSIAIVGVLAPQTVKASDNPRLQPVTPSPLAQAPPAPPPEADPAPAAEAAPSVLWLIAMPAVPIVGGALIYLFRRLSGNPSGECRLIAQVAPRESSTAKDDQTQDSGR